MSVKTRFAPSPTGQMHLGNARTAIFSYLFARKNNGKFILRIEDTDLERSLKEYEDIIINDLKWLSIDWDEFYRQSERFDIYKEYAEKLLQEDKAYRCFCTEEELDKEREEAKRKNIPYRYSGKCRNLTKEEIEKNLKENKPFTIRIKVPENELISFEDLVKGHIAINTDDFGDFVIVRSDKTPVYNFVVVIDDALMGITHVIRGEDHIPNTPKQIVIYRALNFKEPLFAHLPIILGKDRTKLSKRHGAVSVGYYREKGFFPEALLNYLCLLGWSHHDREIFSKEDLIKLFDIKDIHPSPAVFDEEKLYWLNGLYMREILSIEKIIEHSKLFIESFTKIEDEEYLKNIIEKTRHEYNTILEMVEKIKPFFDIEIEIENEAKEELKAIDIKLIAKAFYEKFEREETLTQEKVKNIVKELQKELNIKPRDLWHSLRIIITGKTQGISIDLLVSIIKKEILLKRLEKFI